MPAPWQPAWTGGKTAWQIFEVMPEIMMCWLANFKTALVRGLAELSPNCKAAIRLQSEALDRPLPLRRGMGLRIHLALCVWCARYGRQIKFLRAAARHPGHDHEPAPVLPPGARERIKRRLQAGPAN